jgi:hypothetical protein
VLHRFRLSIGPGWAKPAVVAVGTLIVCEAAASTVLSWAELRRETFMEPVLAGLPDHPRILIVGSSHSARGLDGDLLQAELQTPIAQLSRAGAFAFEQDAGLDKYLAHASPPVVLIELGSEFYINSQRHLFAPYNIEHADLRRTWWGVRLVVGRPDLSIPEQFEAAWDRVRHMLARVMNAGIVRQARHDPVWPEKGFRPTSERPASLTDDDIQRSLATEDGPATNVAAALTFRQWQRDKVLAAGVGKVRFFVPPIADPARRGWADALCAALGQDCMPMDSALVKSIPAGMWADEVHLRPEGARIYTHWFAERLRAVQ